MIPSFDRNRSRSLVALAPLLALFPLCASRTAWAQEPPASAQNGAVEYPTLTAALAAARLPAAGTIAISVGGDRIKLPPLGNSGGVARLDASPAVVQIVRRFGLLSRPFGQVTAIGPTTMVRINTDFQNSNFYDGMPQGDVLTLLLASLSDSQWKSVTGPDGLGVAELTTPDQKLLMQALLPEGKFSVAPWFSRFSNDYKPEEVRDLTRVLPQARLRLSQSFAVGFPDESGKFQYQSDEIPPAPGQSKRYKLTPNRDYGESKESLYGVRVRETVPNKEKAGQLAFTDARLNVAVRTEDLQAMKTIGDLMAHVRSLTKIPVIADPRYATLSLTTLGAPGVSVSASDLLRAVAFSTTATYRRVGPASEPQPVYVLTDDLVGMGTRQSLWYEFEIDGDALRAGPVTKAAQLLYTKFGPGSVRPQGDDALLANPTVPTAPGAGATSVVLDRDASSERGTDKPFDQLTQAQQEAVQRVVDQHNRSYSSQPATTSGKIYLFPQVRAELLVPGFEIPVDMGLSQSTSMLFRIPPEVKAAREAAREAEQQKLMQQFIAQHPEVVTPTPKKLPAAEAAENFKRQSPRRAVLIPVRKVADLDAAIAAMKTLNLNELWLDLPVHPAVSSAAGNTDAGKTDAVALLKAALQAAEKTGITVLPVVSPFAVTSPQDSASEGVVAPSGTRRMPAGMEDSADRNILGETSADAGQHLFQRNASFPFDPQIVRIGQENTRPVPPVYLNPLDPGVFSSTEAAVRRLAKVPGVTGLVLRAPDPDGYGALQGQEDMGRSLLGYSDVMRLAFAREFGADPVDLYTPNYYTGKANTSVPFQERRAQQVSETYQAWKQFRRDQNQAFLRGLGAAVGTTPLLVEQANNSWDSARGVYNSWDNTKRAAPTSYDPAKNTDLGLKPGGPAAPRSPSGTVIKILGPARFMDSLVESQFEPRGQGGAQTAGKTVRNAGAAGTGFVLDLTWDPAQVPNSREMRDAAEKEKQMKIMGLTPPKGAAEALKVLTDIAKQNR